MAKMTAVIVGSDGFDNDILMNLSSFYRELGYRTVYSRRPIPADILVIHRPPNFELDIGGSRLVHVWDYVGNEVSNFARSIPSDINVVWFASSRTRADVIRETSSGSGVDVRSALPPVDVRLWARKIRKNPTLKSVHIGNFKPSYLLPDDTYSKYFLDFIVREKTTVWGMGWKNYIEGPNDRNRIGLSKVSSVYRNSSVALGMMYPFQRRTTLSGRFWHAPLNGCILLSEPSLYAGTVPGVLVFDYSNSDLPSACLESRKRIQQDAVQYWSACFNTLLLEVRDSIIPSKGSRYRYAHVLELRSLLIKLRYIMTRVRWGIKLER
jgi:hypothetical protein